MREQREDHDLGLGADLATLLDRRMALGMLAGAGLAVLTGCGSGTSGQATVQPAGTTSGSCEEIPEETAGPYPGDGSNGPNVLTQSGIVRADITSSFGSASGVAEGIPLKVTLSVQDSGSGCAALAGAAVYLWQCNREGQYSMYSRGVENENYLRGVQQTDANGQVSFEGIFPGCYSGRWPHIQFEVYPSLAAATSAGTLLKTSQLALPKDACDAVYATDGYSASIDNLARITLQSDNVFGDDGAVSQMATISGSVSAGYTATLVMPV